MRLARATARHPPPAKGKQGLGRPSFIVKLRAFEGVAKWYLKSISVLIFGPSFRPARGGPDVTVFITELGFASPAGRQSDRAVCSQNQLLKRKIQKEGFGYFEGPIIIGYRMGGSFLPINNANAERRALIFIYQYSLWSF